MSSTKGFIELKQSSYDFADGLLGVIIKSFLKIANGSNQRIKNDAPVDTGFMRDNVKVDQPSSTSVRIKANAYYSIFVDQGHRTRSGSLVPANPFFSTEADKMKAGAVRTQVDIDVDAFLRGKF